MRTDSRQTRGKHGFATQPPAAKGLLDRVCRLTENSHLRAQAGLVETFKRNRAAFNACGFTNYFSVSPTAALWTKENRLRWRFPGYLQESAPEVLVR